MRILGHMVTRNEVDRWLTSSLPWLAEICHGDVATYDDQSTDGTDVYIAGLGLACSRRPDAMPSFAENEGIFRWAGWQAMERVLRPRDGDWILVVDADELLLTNEAGGIIDDVRLHMLDAIGEAELAGEQSISFQVAEVFDFDGMGWPLVRTDAYWGGVTACRLARWQPGGTFDSRPEGGGSLPSSWPRTLEAHECLELLHLGYARPEDRTAKHERYLNGNDYNQKHLESILKPPTLSYWVGMRPPLRS